MWQAPALTIAAQAFLLNVLTDSSIDSSARVWILVAGILALVAAIASLLRLREREVRYSDAIGYYAELARIRDPRPDELETKPLERHGLFSPLDQLLRRIAAWEHWLPMHLIWALALLLFAVADVVAFSATN